MSLRRGHVVGLVSLVLLALSAVATAAAQAEEPFWKVEGKRLGEGETKEVAVNDTNPLVLKSAATKITVECGSVSVAKGGHLVGSKAGVAGDNINIVIIGKCAVKGNGEGCKVAKEEITTNEETDTLAFNTGKTAIYDYFVPTKGAVFAKIAFEGATCKLKETAVEGSVVAEVLSGGKLVEVGKEPKEVETLELRFPTTPITTAIVNGKEQKAALKAFGTAATLEGTVSMRLTSKQVFGAFTK
jgi:hypothetical protein